jgi:hypothetical protein
VITSSLKLPNETLEETDGEQGHGLSNRFACPSPNIKRRKTCLVESGQMAARTNPTVVGAIGSILIHVEKDGAGRDEEGSKPSLVYTTLVASYPDQVVVVQEEATHYEIPVGWTVVKLEPDC